MICENNSLCLAGPNSMLYEIILEASWFKEKLKEWNLPDTLPKITTTCLSEEGYYEVILQIV